MNLTSLTLRDLTVGFSERMDTSFGRVNAEQNGPAKTTLRRCRTREQGLALLMISHAIEYLLDSHLAKLEESSLAEREALAILLTANLAVYREGAEIISLSSRLRRWFHGGTENKTVDATG